MALSETIVRSSVRIGIILLLLGGVAVICGAVARDRLPGPVDTGVGLWAVYFIVPGTLCILAGRRNIMGFVLIANFIGIIVAAVGSVIGSIFWVFLNTCTTSLAVACVCGVVGDVVNYNASCSDMRVVRNVTAVATIAYAVLVVTSLVGCVYGCIGVCCSSRREPTVVVATTVPAKSCTIVFTRRTGQNPVARQGYEGMAQPNQTTNASAFKTRVQRMLKK